MLVAANRSRPTIANQNSDLIRKPSTVNTNQSTNNATIKPTTTPPLFGMPNTGPAHTAHCGDDVSKVWKAAAISVLFTNKHRHRSKVTGHQAGRACVGCWDAVQAHGGDVVSELARPELDDRLREVTD